ncbi:Acyl carrier protein-like protein [Pseudocohnilembus persalinus]|uniref:Acyl carrier protein-like protein n=1 Tax=Pseudocohnilembus persalinus TaxID=266149 RepID=A0A0V0R5X0_PSEPJ|nr:Acyl carrier protein-like protein [Pseudocohnilembus persalinus]|eukprot:KRX09890.1 Acyl carrier protein-like protein [Pseudocohnilembus persalinus]
MFKAVQKINSSIVKNLTQKNTYFYAPDSIQKRETLSGYYLDPNDVARRFIKIISLHDDIKNPSEIKINSSWEQIGVGELAKVEILLEAEQEFWLEFSDEDAERFRTIEDVVQHVSKSFFAQ